MSILLAMGNFSEVIRVALADRRHTGRERKRASACSSRVPAVPLQRAGEGKGCRAGTGRTVFANAGNGGECAI